jgi:glycosyltransferase involved in cell wall biosynthesis
MPDETITEGLTARSSAVVSEPHETDESTGPSVPDVSIVIPVYDEAESLSELAEQIRQALEPANLTFDVWMIDDGSHDGSWDVIVGLGRADARFRGLRFRRNYGKSAALNVGFCHAAGRFVVTLDGDLQDDPSEIPSMIATLESGYDLVSGWKRTRRDPLSKRVPSRFFNFVTRKISGIPLHDFNCGLKAYRREVVESVHVYGELHRYIPLLAKWEGFERIAEQEVRHRARQYGRTKFGVERFVRGFLDFLSVLFLTRFAARPMHFFGTAGSMAFFGGFLISLYLSYDKLVNGNPLGDRPLLLLGALLILLGAMMFLTGLLGEMIVAPRMQRPESYGVAEETTARAGPGPQ